MTDIQVACTNKTPRQDPYEGITHLGNKSGKWTRQQVIGWIEAGTHTFFTMVQGNRATIAVVQGPGGKYPRTHADGKCNDNLLSLPECP